MRKIDLLVRRWRNKGPVWWAQSQFGFIMPSGEPIELEPWQEAVLDAWWQNKGDVTTLAISNVKKVGKTTLNAVMTAWRWLALPGEHLTAGNDMDQSQGRQFQMIDKMCARHPLLSNQVRSTKSQLVFEPTASTLEAVEVDAAGRAGSNHLTVSHTEAWGIIYESGIRLYEELTPPPGTHHGLPALRIADSYAGWETESKTWHDLVDRGLSGERVSEDWPIYKTGQLLLFHMEGEEAQRRCFRGSAEERRAYYEEQRATLRAGTFGRLHLNKRASGESRFVPLEAWKALVDPECKPVSRGDQRPLWLGVDAATKRDNLALVGCTYNEEKDRPELAYVREWDPETLPRLAGGVDLDETLGREILRLHRENNVEGVYFDPYQLASIANNLEKAGVPMEELPQTSQRTKCDQGLWVAITSGTLATYPSPPLTAAMKRAAAKEGLRGWRLIKRAGDDLVVALSMAHFGVLERPAQKKKVRAWRPGY